MPTKGPCPGLVHLEHFLELLLWPCGLLVQPLLDCLYVLLRCVQFRLGANPCRKGAETLVNILVAVTGLEKSHACTFQPPLARQARAKLHERLIFQFLGGIVSVQAQMALSQIQAGELLLQLVQ